MSEKLIKELSKMKKSVEEEEEVQKELLTTIKLYKKELLEKTECETEEEALKLIKTLRKEVEEEGGELEEGIKKLRKEMEENGLSY